MPLDIIGAGLGRTGTKTMKTVLEQLGLGPCYHMVDLFADTSRLRHWEDAEAGRETDWEALFDGYRAVVDYPGCDYYQELTATYPDAKVILTVRDPEAWYESTLATIYPTSRGGGPPPPPETDVQRIHSYIWKAVWSGRFEERFEDRDFAIAKFEEHTANVRAHVPAEKLLVYEVKDGWEPLCAFLGIPVPDEPFAHVNTRQEFVERVRSR